MAVLVKKIIIGVFIMFLFFMLALHIIKEPKKGITVTPSKDVSLPITEVGKKSDAKIFTIENTGQETIIIVKVLVEEEKTNYFRINDNVKENTKLKPGAKINFDVIFMPEYLGTYNASIIIKTDIKGSEEQKINIAGTAINSFDYTLLPANPPVPPVAVMAAFEGDKIVITWKDEPNVALPDSYNLYISDNEKIDPTKALKISNISKPYIYTNYTLNKPLYFAVTSQDENGEGKLSEIVSVRPATVYYVSSINGNDFNKGLSAKTPWKTLTKVNSYNFKAGDFILFEKGTEYYGTLTINNSGIKGKQITYGAYGKGSKPLISNMGEVPKWNDEKSWTNEGNNIWSIYYGPWKIARRLWLSGEEYAKAEVLKDVNNKYRWFFDIESSLLYVYAEKNPAIQYSSIKESTVNGETAISINNQKHVNIIGIEASNISINNTSYISIENCTVGRSAYMGIVIAGLWNADEENINKASNYGVIKGSIVESNYKLDYYYEKSNTEDGIHMRNNVSNWKIYGNEVKNWGHTGIDLWQVEANTKVSHNHIFSNYITAEDIVYGRAFSTKGRPNGCSANHFYRNYVYNTAATIQIGGDYNLIYYNIIDTVRNSPIIDFKNGSGIVLTPAMGTNTEYITNHNKIFNNLVYNAATIGIDIQDWHGNSSTRYNEVINNIIVNCGQNSEVGKEYAGIALSDHWYIDEPSAAEHNIIRNNLVYSDHSEVVVHYRGEQLTIGQLNNRNGIFDTIVENYYFDPMLTDINNKNYLPKKLLGIVDNGFTIKKTFDLLGNIVPLGERTDIGPYEVGNYKTHFNN